MKPDLFEAIDKAELSDVTKKNYRDRLRAMSGKAEDVDIMDIVMKPTVYIPLIKKWYPIVTSHKIHYTAILALFRYNPDFKEKNIKIHEKWVAAFKEADDKVNERYELNEPTKRQIEGYVPYEDVVKKRDSLPIGDINRLLLDMYTHLTPMRCEYARVALYHGSVPSKPESNYIFLSPKKSRLIITDFKTKKHHDSFDIELPQEILVDLHKSLKDTPRDWLFINSKGEPFTRTCFTQWTSRVFLALFKKTFTVSLLRHSYINTLDFNTLSIKDKKLIADSMGHTVGTQDRYRLIF